MKVLSFITSISQNCGGPSRSVPLLVKGLAEAGVDMTLMTFYSDDMNTHALDGTSAKMKVLNKRITDKEIEEYLLSENFDLIQMQSIWDPPYHQLAKIARKLRIPYLITPRGMLEPWSLSQKKWKKKLALMLYQMKDLQKAACIFTTADMEAQHVRELGVKVPLSIIPNGIETDGYTCRTSEDGVKKQILFLSRIHEKKGIEILIDAFAQLHDEFADWKVLIVGNGEMEYINSLKLKVKNLEMENCIEILPPVFGSDKIKLYQDSSLFCLPSYSENFGMVIAEAMSCGVPVITTTNCPWEILNDTKTGWCIELSVENLKQALKEALNMPTKELYQMGQNASRLVFENFNYRNVAQRTYELYTWILEGGKKPSFVQL
ncbi:MAG: glycosyltransferase [Bacteroidales bacterium]|nr:glycosyltransferase [Candidatus Physcousia equi]